MTVTFTLSLLLIPYALILAIVAVFAVFNLRHLVEHGATARFSYAVILTFLTGVTAIMILTWQGLSGVDWRQPVSLTPPTASFVPPRTADTNSP